MLRSLLLFAVAAPLLVGCPTSSGVFGDDDDATDPGPSWEPIPQSIAEAIADEVDAIGAPGAAVAILYGDTLYASGFGTRDPDLDDPVLPTTLFRIGSVTKMLTSTALLAQVDAGTVALDDAVTDHLPGLDLQGAASAEDMTLHDMISHQGGLSDYTPIAGGAEDERLLDHALGSFGNNVYLMAPPGLFWNYSNPNFALAGAVVEAASGDWYREAMAADVFDPLGMDRTMFLGEEVLADGDYAVAMGRDWTGSGDIVRVEPDDYDDAFSRPAGFAWSSVLDMVVFGEFLLDGDPSVLPASLHAELVARQVDTLAFLDRLHYGYGVMQFDGMSADGWYELSTIEHNGAIPGFAAELITVPEHDLVIACLASTDDLYLDRGLAAIVEELLDAETASLPDLEIDPDDFGAYTGTYLDPYNVGEVIVTLEGSDLFVDMPDLDAAGVPYSTVLTPTSRGNFRTTVSEYPIGMTFVPGPDAAPGDPTRFFRTRYYVADRAVAEAGDGRLSVPLGPDERRARITAMLAAAKAPTLR